MARTYLHILANYYVKPTRYGYSLGTLQTKKGGGRSLVNTFLYGSISEAVDAALQKAVRDGIVSREIKNVQDILTEMRLLKEEISATVQILNTNFPPKVPPKAETLPTSIPTATPEKEDLNG